MCPRGPFRLSIFLAEITSSLNPSLDFHMCPRTGWTSTKDTESNTLLQIRRHLVTTHGRLLGCGLAVSVSVVLLVCLPALLSLALSCSDITYLLGCLGVEN